MHFHAYEYRPQGQGKPPADFDERYRSPGGEFWDTSPWPPAMVPHWLRKPARFIQGTWDSPEDAVKWIESKLNELWTPEEIERKNRMPIEASLDCCRKDLAYGRDYMATGPVGFTYAEFYILTCPNGAGAAPCPIGRTDTRPPGLYKNTGVP